MGEIWSTDPEKILKELSGLEKKGITLTMCLPEQENKGIALKSVEKKAGEHYLVFEKKETFSVSGNTCLFFYKPNEYLTRGFKSVCQKETERFFSVLLPIDIFVVSKRKFTRVDTPRSTATFSQKGKTKLFHCTVLDVSLEGAMFTGDVPRDLENGDVVGPVTMNLFTKSDSEETIVQVAEATIMNIIGNENSDDKKVGLHFHENAASQATLSPYINVRVKEDNKEEE